MIFGMYSLCLFLILSHCSNIGIDYRLLHESYCVIVCESHLHLHHLYPEEHQHGVRAMTYSHREISGLKSPGEEEVCKCLEG